MAKPASPKPSATASAKAKVATAKATTTKTKPKLTPSKAGLSTPALKPGKLIRPKPVKTIKPRPRPPSGGVVKPVTGADIDVDFGLVIDDLEVDADAIDSLPAWFKDGAVKTGLFGDVSRVIVTLGGGSTTGSSYSLTPTVTVICRKVSVGRSAERGEARNGRFVVMFAFDDARAGETKMGRIRYDGRKRAYGAMVFMDRAMLGGMVALAQGAEHLKLDALVYEHDGELFVRAARLITR